MVVWARVKWASWNACISFHLTMARLDKYHIIGTGWRNWFLWWLIPLHWLGSLCCLSQAAEKWLCWIEKTVPNTGLSQFWRSRSVVGLDAPSPTLWNHVLFSQKFVTTVVHENLFVPTTPHCYEYQDKMTLDIDDVERIETVTRDLRNGRLTSSRFGKIRNRKETTNPRRLVRDIMGCGNNWKRYHLKCFGDDKMSRKLSDVTLKICLTVGEGMTVTPSGLHLCLTSRSFTGNR